MKLQPHCSSDKAFVWKTPADFADEEAKQETLAIKFGNAESKSQIFCVLVQNDISQRKLCFYI